MTESFTADVSLEQAMVRIEEFMYGKFGTSKQGIEVYRENSDNPLFTHGTNEITINRLDDSGVEIEFAGPELGIDEVLKAVTSDRISGGIAGSQRRTVSRDEEEEAERVIRDMSKGVSGVFKPFGHDEADYRSPSDRDFDSSHERCRSCAHYDEHGNCRIVEDIEPDGYCSQFYADVVISAHEHAEGAEINLVAYGEEFDWDENTIDNFILEARERLEERTEER